MDDEVRKRGTICLLPAESLCLDPDTLLSFRYTLPSPSSLAFVVHNQDPFDASAH